MSMRRFHHAFALRNHRHGLRHGDIQRMEDGVGEVRRDPAARHFGEHEAEPVAPRQALKPFGAGARRPPKRW
jgi:hypothetical protein